jgi:hypothetical protein
MPDKSKVDDKPLPTKPDEKPGHESVDAPFDEIIGAILNANPQTIREHQEARRRKRKTRDGRLNDISKGNNKPP